MNDLRNLLVAATNKLIEEGHVRLDSTPVQNGYIITELFGRTSAILFQDIGFDEVRISVWWDYNHDTHPQAKLSGSSREEFTTSSPLAKKSAYPKFVSAVVSGWFERKEGFYLQGKGSNSLFDTYVKTTAKPVLASLPRATPNGFKSEGKFHI